VVVDRMTNNDRDDTPVAIGTVLQRWQCCHCGGTGLDSYGDTCPHCEGLGFC
jgi:hypothetical protein